MNKIFVVVLIISSFSSSAQIKYSNKAQQNLRNTVIKYIKKDLMAKKEFLQLRDSIEFKDFKGSIPFDIVTICEDLISKEYYAGFSFDSVDSNNALKALAKRVRDSLSIENEKINMACTSYQATKEKELWGKPKNTLIVFYSNECQSKIYVNVVPSAGVSEWNGALEMYGEAYSYLFLFDKKHKIKKVYKGLVINN